MQRHYPCWSLSWLGSIQIITFLALCHAHTAPHSDMLESHRVFKHIILGRGLAYGSPPHLLLHIACATHPQAQTLVLSKRHKSARELSPIRQRAMQFRTGLSKAAGASCGHMGMGCDVSSIHTLQHCIQEWHPPSGTLLYPSIHIASFRWHVYNACCH